MSQRAILYARQNAEVRGMISRLLSPEQLRVLAAVPDLEGILRSLSETPYWIVISDLLGEGATLARAERAMATCLASVYRRTALLVGGAGAALVATMGRRMETDNLKAVLRAKARGEPSEAVRPLLVPLGGLSNLPLDELLRAENLDAVAAALAETEYGRALHDALHRWVAERSLFPVEVALDLNYYRQLWAAVQRLPERDRQVVGRIMGVRYDTLNVDWIIRYRLIYALSPEAVFNYTLPYGWRIDNDVVRRAASADGIDAIVAALPNPYRSLLLTVASSADPVGQAELTLQRYLVTVARLSLSGYPFHLGVAVAFLVLKEAEVHDLWAILEGNRYGRPAEWIVSQMWGGV